MFEIYGLKDLNSHWHKANEDIRILVETDDNEPIESEQMARKANRQPHR
jgi:hypothetical protein